MRPNAVNAIGKIWLSNLDHQAANQLQAGLPVVGGLVKGISSP